MDARPFGATGLAVTPLGYGAGEIGHPEIAEAAAERLLHAVLDAGLTFVDTARSYGHSEERIGRYLHRRRDAFVLSTKVGYGVPGVADWTYEAVRQGIEAARQRLRSDVLDVVHLHSCPQTVLAGTGVVDALAEAVGAGKVRVAAYSGENEDLACALATGRFGALQTSLNLFDQRSIGGTVSEARERGLGVIGKRPLGNAPWRFAQRPEREDVAVYWLRMRAMALDFDLPWAEVALRFAAYHTGAHTCLAATTNPAHLRANVAAVKTGPLPDALVTRIRAAFARHDDGWVGLV
jgi:aryl-alcohol dehydrogenase-like predicted oxidoreductase